ncbi:MAG: BLUF domain-containing protein [Gloeomargarita sp. DG_2_bins_126]
MSLYRMIYISRAVPGLGYQDLRDIMSKSEVNNSHVGLTGLLCFGNGIFLQILEGSRLAISQTYHRILQDPRHHSAEIVVFEPVLHREFVQWSMKLVQIDENSPEKMRRLYWKYSGEVDFAPQTMTPVQCLQFMMEIDPARSLTKV